MVYNWCLNDWRILMDNEFLATYNNIQFETLDKEELTLEKILARFHRKQITPNMVAELESQLNSIGCKVSSEILFNGGYMIARKEGKRWVIKSKKERIDEDRVILALTSRESAREYLEANRYK